MLFFLRKLIEAMLLPIGFSGLLALAGVIFRRRWPVVVGVAILYVSSMPIVGRLLMEPLEAVYPPEQVAAAPAADAIVVLSGSILRGVSAPGIQWGDSANRYFAGLDLAEAGKAKAFVISTGTSSSEGPILRDVAIRHGIPAERIIVTKRVQTTEDESVAVSGIPGIHSILLVTSAFHMPRAVMLFRARGLEVSPFPTDERALGRREYISGLTPIASGLRNSEEAIREYYGLAVYRFVLLFRKPLA